MGTPLGGERITGSSCAPSYDVFVSYARKDGFERARRLQADLITQGLTAWRDERDLNPDADFTAELETAIERSRSVVCCVTPDVRRYESFVQREIAYASTIRKPVIPLIFEDTIPPIRIINITWEDFTHVDWNDAVKKLVARLNRRDEPIPVSLDRLGNYLRSLYEEIVSLLRQLVFAEIELKVDWEPLGPEGGSRSYLTSMLQSFARQRVSEEAFDLSRQDIALREAFYASHGRMMLIGGPGSGKTISLLAFARHMVAQRIARSDAIVPFVTQIYTWSPSFHSLVAWLASQTAFLTEDDIASIIENKQALLILDGLDEIKSPKKDNETNETKVSPQELFLDQLPAGGQLVVSTRPPASALTRSMTFNATAHLRSFNDDQLAKYVSTSPALDHSLKADPVLRELARTPLFLAILQYCFSQTGDEVALSTNSEKAAGARVENIFHLYVSRRLHHEADRLGSQPFTEDEIYDLLGEIAFEEASDDPITDTFGNQDVSQQVSRALTPSKATEFVNYCIGLQLFVRDDRGVVRFSHLLLRRHFGRGVCLKRWNSTVQWSSYNYYRDEMLSALKAMKKLAWFGDERELEHLLYAAKLNVSEPRASAIMALGGIGHPDGAQLLCSFLSDRHMWHREAAVCDVACWALIQTGASALPALREMVKTGATPSAVALALLVLSRIKSEEALQLVQELSADQRFVDNSLANTPTGLEGSEVLYDVGVGGKMISELAATILAAWRAGKVPFYGVSAFLRERGAEPWSMYWTGG